MSEFAHNAFAGDYLQNALTRSQKRKAAAKADPDAYRVRKKGERLSESGKLIRLANKQNYEKMMSQYTPEQLSILNGTREGKSLQNRWKQVARLNGMSSAQYYSMLLHNKESSKRAADFHKNAFKKFMTDIGAKGRDAYYHDMHSSPGYVARMGDKPTERWNRNENAWEQWTPPKDWDYTIKPRIDVDDYAEEMGYKPSQALAFATYGNTDFEPNEKKEFMKSDLGDRRDAFMRQFQG